MKLHIVVLVCALTALLGGAFDEIRRACEERWADDYEMQLDCVQRHEQAALDLLSLKKGHSGKIGGVDIQLAIDKCVGKWVRTDDRYNFEMALDCSRRQVEAYRELEGLDSVEANIQKLCSQRAPENPDERYMDRCRIEQEIGYEYIEAFKDDRGDQVPRCIDEHSEGGLVDYSAVAECIK